MRTPEHSRSDLFKTALSSVFIFCGISITILSLEYLLFKRPDFNIYRVMDNSFENVLVLLFFLIFQYAYLRKMPFYIKNLRETLWKQHPKWIFAFGIFLSGQGLYALFPSHYPFWIFSLVALGFIVFSFLVNKTHKAPFTRILLTLLFAAGLNTSLIFWMHEETNQEIHFQYARQLAINRDTLAEQHLADMLRQKKNNTNTTDRKLFWEKKWLENPYLASNYRFHFDNFAIPAGELFAPIFSPDKGNTPKYRIFLPDSTALSFTLTKILRKSIYTQNVPFKNLQRLNDYNFAVFQDNEIVFTNTHDFDLGVPASDLPAIGTGIKIKQPDYDARLYRHAEKKYVLIGEPLSEFEVWLSNFAYFFSLILISVIFWKVLFLISLKENLTKIWQRSSIQIKIQITLLTMTLVLFFVIAASTFIFLHRNNSKAAEERQIYIAETLREEILEEQEQYGWTLEEFSVETLAELADRKRCDIDFYTKKGNLLASSIASAENSPASGILETQTLSPLSQQPSAILVNPFLQDGKKYLKTAFGIVKDKKVQGYVAINAFESEIGSAHDIPVIMSHLLNVYVFLLLLAWGVGLFFNNILTRPLKVLAKHLRNFKLGKQNKKLDWEGDDAIGRLIGEYNKMIDKIDLTSKELAKKEREGAWQIMAQQIAHEINNPLTPLRLNIEYLTYAISGSQSADLDRIKQITKGLLDQVDHLSHVATQFRLFANMESPKSTPLELKPVLQQFFSPFEKRSDYQFTFQNGIGKRVFINIDQNHLRQVLHNIIKNAEQAIPENKEGIISMNLKVADKRVIIEIADNGPGIPEEIGKNIFSPSFSTKSTGSGLGLPICNRIVEFYNGELSFETQSGKGTCFKIAFPLIEN